MPGPKGLPFIGQALDLFKNANNPNAYFTELANQYGDFVKIKLLNNKMVILSDPKAVRELARGEEGRLTLHASRHYKLEKGMIRVTMDYFNHENWNDIRQVLNIPLKPQYFNEVILPQLTELNNELLKSFVNTLKFDENSKQYYFADPMYDIMSQFAFSAVIKVFLGVKVTEKELIEKLGFTVRQYIKDAVDTTDLILKLQYQPGLYKYGYKTKDYKDFEELSDISFGRGFKLVDLLSDRYDGKIPRLKELVEERAKMAGFLSEATTTVLSAFMIGGVDVTARMMTTLLYRIAHEKEWAQKLYEETAQVFGEPTADELTMDSVIPVRNSRLLTKDTILGAYKLEKGTQVLFLDVPSVQSKYVPRGIEFLPERHIKGSEISEPKDYLGPFGTGARKCPGERVATNEIYFALIALVRHFKLTHSNGNEFPPFSVEKSMYYMDPTKYRVFFTPRDHLLPYFK
ncbi:predicted protein [Naegleria gruberi]|uniref:Predicted protein n=1 Tax=Naegleria gruberi TaxID=5762 RepID=D2VHJ5_NAEGR|nr:uncharacterized protein NAEGRDRAFT_68348 [Naegleria gruberi]EFC43691.1 predicted protein [Naegleria gruberi]|eukprot:XP_002676435.1 predicted protein [Naegleria gruberi strain NEG-M]